MTDLRSVTIINELAEGSPQQYEPDERPKSTRTVMIPPVKLSSGIAPSAETGVLPAVVIPAESHDNDDAQDASRTTAETIVYPAFQAVGSRKPSVLIVEDTAELAEIIQATLQRMNFLTVHESHGQKALARYRELKPDVVLLDIGLPDTTGWKLLESFKELDIKLPIVIVITAYGDAANRLVGKLQNVHAYLVKPFTADEVERVVINALGGKAG